MVNELLQEIIERQYKPKPVLLIGNGINRIANGNISWESILNDLISEAGDGKIRKGNKPLTFLFEEILHSMKEGATSENERKLKKIVSGKLDVLKPNKFHRQFMSLNVQYYLTTNYDYCLERSLDENFTKTRQKGSKKYSLTRYHQVGDKCIWHIHGELDNGKVIYRERSVMLGFDQYMRTLMEMADTLNGGHYRNTKKTNLEEEISRLFKDETEEKNWLSFFFTHNIHIIALDLGLFETHLWWLLHYRVKLAAREKLTYKNHLIYYLPSYELLVKRDQVELLESLGIKIEGVQCAFNKADFYHEFYEKTYELIKSSIG